MYLVVSIEISTKPLETRTLNAELLEGKKYGCRISRKLKVKMRSRSPFLYKNDTLKFGCFHGTRYLTNFLFIDLEATVGIYELRYYRGEQQDRQGVT